MHANAWITTHLPTPEGWKAELALLADPLRTDSLNTKWSPVNKRSGTGQTKYEKDFWQDDKRVVYLNIENSKKMLAPSSYTHK